jgi:thiol-disulfide isomerase/thioredoxin
MRLLLFLLLLSFECKDAFCQKALPFNLKGKFASDTTEGKMYLMYEINGKGNIDSFFVRKGRFSFSENILHPVFAILAFNRAQASLFLSPGATTILCRDSTLKEIETSGSKTDLEYREIDKNIRKINKRWQVVLDTLDAVSTKSITRFQELRDWVLLPYFEECREAYGDFFAKHPQSFVTAYYLSQNVIEMNQGVFPTDSLRTYYQKFAVSVKNSWYGQQIAVELAKRKIAVAGTEAFDFTGTDINGQSLSLSSFRGKYILLDFWGSWCIPCRRGNPHLKELYARYKDKGFDIIGIAKDDNTKNAWVKAVEKDGLPWHHILCGSLDTKYNVTSYPTKILVDTKGIIIGRFGEDEIELDNQLKAIFNDVPQR